MFIDSGLERPGDRLAERERALANRATVLTLTAILLVLVGTIASIAGFRSSDRALVHALVTAPFPLAVVTAAAAYRLRRATLAVREGGARQEIA